MTLKWCDEAEAKVQISLMTIILMLVVSSSLWKGKDQMILASPEHSGKGGRAKVEEILSKDTDDDKVLTGAFLATN
jgi:hypothetical protein